MFAIWYLPLFFLSYSWIGGTVLGFDTYVVYGNGRNVELLIAAGYGMFLLLADVPKKMGKVFKLMFVISSVNFGGILILSSFLRMLNI